MSLPKDTNKSFIKKAVNRWGDKYDYSLVDYKCSRTPVTIICNIHKKPFEQTPKAHFAAKHHCCKLCYQEVAGTFQNEWRLKGDKEEVLESDKFSALLSSVFSPIAPEQSCSI